ncbi:metal cation transporter [Halobiforma lacisalsi AJ5]|uniref:Metal cation transporter n=1 Tax=Natronobacterium lacisalsi AJ5 TaxID=358396 RepID=M0LCU6_NATLA|nr:hypothetical protein [Halobiforma lacisalsi]APW99125.1 metal cation transporter [Halobiforma lacisalsi AJ5]EMA30933.1 zinc transporter [Halobiforma lacisalsi AJ5]
MRDRSLQDLPRWLLAIGPLVVLAVVFGLLSLTSPFGDLSAGEGATTLEIVRVLTVIGSIAGIVPVAIGMLWFPFIRNLPTRYLHGFMALAAGVLAFIAVEMVGDVADYAGEASNTPVVLALALAGIGTTFAVMYLVSRWRQHAAAGAEKSGLEVAYLVAFALGLHSVGEGLGIGVAYVQGNTSLLTLLVLAFIMHNVMEGPTVVAAVARDHETPPLWHFAGMGLLAGGPVILGGWIGSIAQSAALAAVFFGMAIGAVLQVLIEVAELIRFDAEAVITRTNAVTFSMGFALMFLLEDVLTAVFLEGWLASV